MGDSAQSSPRALRNRRVTPPLRAITITEDDPGPPLDVVKMIHNMPEARQHPSTISSSGETPRQDGETFLT